MAGLAARGGRGDLVMKSLQAAGPGEQGGGMGWSSWEDQGEAGSDRCSLAAPAPHFEKQSAAIAGR